MIVKFLGNKGGGSAGATMDYLLGEDRDRDGAILLSGDPDLTARIADNLDFQNRYTVGVLSFEENNLAAHQKQEIMQSFEKALLAGLDRDQYDIIWIEHTDKGRLELNFVIPNVELSTGKRLQPYFDQADRPLVENWKQVTNFEYGLSDPHAPDKAQAIKTLKSQNLPESVKEIKQHIGTAIAEQISNGSIQNRKDVVNTLEKAGFEITRQTEKSISIKNPDGIRNIRLEGIIYENRQFDKQFAEEHSRTRENYQGTSRERYDTALGKLHSLVEKKQQGNSQRFTSQYRDHSNATVEDQKRIAFEYVYRTNSRHSGNSIPDTSRDESLARKADSSQESRIGRIESESGKNAPRKADSEQGEIGGKRGQEITVNCSEEQQKGRSLSRHQQSHDIKDRKVKESKFQSPFDNSFNRSVGSIELLKDTEYLFKNVSKSPIKQPNQDQTKQLEEEHAKRLYESLQRVIKLIREATEQAERDKSKADRADRNIEYSESNIERTERGIKQSKSAIIESEQQIEKAERRIDKKLISNKHPEIDRGFYL